MLPGTEKRFREPGVGTLRWIIHLFLNPYYSQGILASSCGVLEAGRWVSGSFLKKSTFFHRLKCAPAAPSSPFQVSSLSCSFQLYTCVYFCWDRPPPPNTSSLFPRPKGASIRQKASRDVRSWHHAVISPNTLTWIFWSLSLQCSYFLHAK